MNCKICHKPLTTKNRKTCSESCSLINIELIKRKYYEKNKELVIKKAKLSRENDPNHIHKMREYRKKNKDRLASYYSEYRTTDKFKKRKKELDAKYRDNNREKINSRQRKFAKENPERSRNYGKKYSKTFKGMISNNISAAKRRSLKKNALPDWVDLKELKQIYIDVKNIQWLSEEKLEVDHIIPLKNDSVCGLHVPWNLQIIPMKINRSKGNKLELN